MSGNKKILVRKASGQEERFDEKKLRRSLLRAGAGEHDVHKIVSQIKDSLYSGITTTQIYKAAFMLLRKGAKPVASRYKLKLAIMELGPSGFPFERYVAAILQEQGFKTQTGIIVQGHCVKHEVDVIAEKDNHHYMVECKYHNHRGTVCDVKIPLYINSRFKDVEARWIKLPGHDIKLHQGWVVTNTKFTSDAILYGTCIGLNLLGWDYPRKGSLNELIERLGLYPLTSMTTISRSEKQVLLDAGIVLCRDIVDRPELLKQIDVTGAKAAKILSEAQILCEKLLRRNGQLATGKEQEPNPSEEPL